MTNTPCARCSQPNRVLYQVEESKHHYIFVCKACIKRDEKVLGTEVDGEPYETGFVDIEWIGGSK